MSRRKSPLFAIYRWLSSRKTAVLLIFLLGLALLLAELVPQEANFQGDDFAAAIAEAWWMQACDAVGLTRLRGSTLIVTLFATLLLNLSMNLVQRLRTLHKELRLQCPRQRSSKLEQSQDHRRIAVADGLGDPIAVLEQRLRAKRFATDRRDQGLLAIRGRFAPLGSLLFHVSLIVVAAGGLLSHQTRIHGMLMLAEGEHFDGSWQRYTTLSPRGLDVEELPPLAFTLEDIGVTFDDADHVMDAVMTLLLPDGAREIVRVNYPYRLGDAGVRFVDYGIAPVFAIRDPISGKEVPFAAKLALMPPGREDSFTVPDLQAEFRAVIWPDYYEQDGKPRTHSRDLRNPIVGLATTLPDGRTVSAKVPLGSAFVQVGPWQVAVTQLLYYARIDMDKDGGRFIVYAGFILGLLGVMWRLFLPIRRIDAVLDGEPGQGAVLHLAARSDYTREPFASRFHAIVDALDKELSGS